MGAWAVAHECSHDAGARLRRHRNSLEQQSTPYDAQQPRPTAVDDPAPVRWLAASVSVATPAKPHPVS